MNMNIDTMFSQDDRRRIEEAVRAAEKTTSGEIVPVVVGQSSPFDEALWRAAAMGALLASLIAALLYGGSGAWGIDPWLWIAAPALCGAGLGFFLAAYLAPVKRALVSPHDIDREVRQRAAVAFLDREVFDTRERTGILIFLSLFERRVVILGDSGINARVQQSEWDAIVKDLAAGIKRGRSAEALIAAIGRCGELLTRRGVAIKSDDSDELPDRLQIEKE
jgi:putative membrane protein